MSVLYTAKKMLLGSGKITRERESERREREREGERWRGREREGRKEEENELRGNASGHVSLHQQAGNGPQLLTSSRHDATPPITTCTCLLLVYVLQIE